MQTGGAEASSDVSPEDPSPSPRMACGVLKCSINGRGMEVKAVSAPDKKSHTSSSASPSLHHPGSKVGNLLPTSQEQRNLHEKGVLKNVKCAVRKSNATV